MQSVMPRHLLGKHAARLSTLLLLASAACSIHTPEMKFTGEKTALENQILGTYNQVKEDVWMVASVRAVSPDSQIVISEEKRLVLTAIQNREFNKDDVEEFKREGLVGENARGYLEIRDPQRAAADPERARLLEKIVAEENRDRQIIMQRIIDINPAIAASDQAEVEKAFASLNRESAKPGEWIQLPNGEWVRKSKP
ncbi:MAG: YdbL family protein [candidate division KSB1 bacterium]|nr:YdbL family protein [candidate division KSB1 bacterium]MDZ7276393.1 YdbL family protein [candidate division KSB1 bacterium]MDZ7288064.1 YdbL family protein [candidate division KSB1 bacterium]MDZ7300163.1 YdbL family protein [candidate division KSB1 bacterium]MDZ7351165.1 YdbL family protein [candidate division KSB1 bacterium]